MTGSVDAASRSQISSVPPPPGAADTAREKMPFTVDFLPVYDGRAGRVNTLYCRPSATTPEGGTAADEELLALGTGGRGGMSDVVVRTMLHTLDMAAARAGMMRAGGDGRKLIVPVNGAALARREIASVLTERCRELSREITQALIFEVTNAEDDTSLSVLDEIAIILHPFCLTYSARIKPKTQDLKLYATCNYTGIALHLKDKPWPMKAVGGYFADLTQRTEASRLKAYCHGLGTPELVEAALSAGVRFVSGPGVKPWLATQGG